MNLFKNLCGSLLILIALGMSISANAASQGPITFADGVDCHFGSDQTTNTTCVMGDDGVHDWKTAGNNLEHLGDTALVTYIGDCHMDLYWYWSQYTQAWLQHVGGPWNQCGENNEDPLVLDMEGDGFGFTNPDTDTVRFDLNADGELESVTWTKRRSDDAFLAIDLNNNNRIDDGSELFSDRFVLPNGKLAMTGYEALRELDKPANGGNGDGIISRADSMFGDILLWTDSNHNGVSERRELKSLRQRKVSEINLTYYFNNEFDEYGNELRFNSTATLKRNGNEREINTINVYLQTQ